MLTLSLHGWNIFSDYSQISDWYFECRLLLRLTSRCAQSQCIFYVISLLLENWFLLSEMFGKVESFHLWCSETSNLCLTAIWRHIENVIWKIGMLIVNVCHFLLVSKSNKQEREVFRIIPRSPQTHLRFYELFPPAIYCRQSQNRVLEKKSISSLKESYCRTCLMHY